MTKSLKKILKNFIKRSHQKKINGWPYAFIMMFFIIFIMQMIMLIILIKQK